MLFKYLRLNLTVLCLGLSLVLSGCTGKQRVHNIYTDNAESYTESGQAKSGSGKRYPKGPQICQDLKDFPQDLLYYAKNSPGIEIDRLIISQAEQAEHDAKFNQRFLRPWQISSTPKSKDIFLGQRYLNPKRGYAENLQSYPSSRWAQLVANCNEKAYPSRVVRAITVRNTSLRMMPTDTPFLLSPSLPGEGYPFDQYQNSSLWVGSPVQALHSSADGEWTLVTTPAASGWAKTQDLAEVDDQFAEAWSNTPHWAVVIKDGVVLEYEKGKSDAVSGGKFLGKAHVGAVLPLAGKGKHGALQVKVPVRGPDGRATSRIALLSADEAAQKPLPFTARNIARISNEMIGQPYGWGGYLENRDCSSTMKDLFAVFGMWLPRNSGSQATWGKVINLKGMSPQEKEAVIAREAKPFTSLIWMPGHIGLYAGNHPKSGRPAFFHNVWGLKVKSGSSVSNSNGGVSGQNPSLNPVGDDPDVETLEQSMEEQNPEVCEINVYNGRIVIGRAVVTSLSPGAELPNIAKPYGLLERIERIVILPEAETKTPLQPKSSGKKVSKAKKNAKDKNLAAKKGKAGSKNALAAKNSEKTASKVSAKSTAKTGVKANRAQSKSSAKKVAAGKKK